MGLDMYAYTATKAGQMSEHYEGYDYETDTSPVEKPREIAYWRKHPNLHGWMDQLWLFKLAQEGKVPPESDWGSGFNGIELELTWEDLDELEHDVKEGRLPGTSGFFFGETADEYYKDQDLEFIKNARTELFSGLKVFYNSSW